MKALSPDSPLVLAKFPLPASSNKSSTVSGVAPGAALGAPSLWRARIENDDAQAVWRSLHRLVKAHPLVRSALGYSHLSSHPAPLSSLNDLTQDLYLLLLQKGRFDHYLVAQMTDAEIEREIYQIELTNLLIGNLRRRRPENYRIVRRVSGVLEGDPQFRQFTQGAGGQRRYRQASDAIYGLRHWSDNKKIKDSGVFGELINHIPMRMRDRRRAGCAGDTQVIVSNQELIELMVEIFEAIDSPAPLRVLRQLALSKLPVCDPEMTSIDDEVNEERRGRNYDWVASSEASPEQTALLREQEKEARRAAAIFLDHLSLLVRSNPQRAERLWRVLWHCFFDSDEPSQLEIAELVGISDSSVSDYRRRIEAEMRKLDFTPEQLSWFAEELDEELRWRLSLPEKSDIEFDAHPIWARFDPALLTGFESVSAPVCVV
jgi:hypothetical protein